MSADVRHMCALGVTDATLSALHDGALTGDEAQRLRAHAATCEACAQRLAAYERVGDLLRGQRLPTPDARWWDEVGAAITMRRGRGYARTAFGSVGGYGALAAVLLVALLFSVVLRTLSHGAGSGVTLRATPAATATAYPTATAQPTATATVAPVDPLAAPVSWQHYTLPRGVTLDFPISTIGLAPSDGNTAYVCQGGAPGQLAQVIVTHDRGAHWAQVAGVDVGSTCNPVVVDQHDPNTVAVGSGPTYVTRDGGATWTHDLFTIESLATLGARTYGVLNLTNEAGTGVVGHLEVSDDGMRSWQPIDSGIAGETRAVWVNAQSGSLLAVTLDYFWQSDDGGVNWRKFLPGIYYGSVVAPFDATRWRICFSDQCTMNGGQTWDALPPLGAFTVNSPMTALAIDSDGSVVVGVDGVIYQAAVGDARWKMLGAAPEHMYAVECIGRAAGGGNGTLWALPPGGKSAFNDFYTAALPRD